MNDLDELIASTRKKLRYELYKVMRLISTDLLFDDNIMFGTINNIRATLSEIESLKIEIGDYLTIKKKKELENAGK